jgi:AAA+ ATPase superfamily predicted ATPase
MITSIINIFQGENMKFINRVNELAALKKARTNGSSGFAVVYGKRRVGKTELIKQFLKEHDGIYFLADRRPVTAQLKEVSLLLGEYFKDAFIQERGFGDWVQVFRYLKEKCNKAFVFAVDEFPYLVETDDSVKSLFQKGWDEYLKNSKVLLILSGSSISMMESEVLSHKSPLFGRRTAQILVRPMSFQDSKKFYPDVSYEGCLKTYAMTGGMPAYLNKMDAKLSTAENAIRYVFPPDQYLHNEPEFLLKEELRQPRYYFEILRSMALGKTKFGEIASDTGLEKSSLTKYINVLESLYFIEREYPVTEKNSAKSKKSIYKVSDNFIKFWFNYVYPNRSQVEMGSYASVINSIHKTFPTQEALTYEKACCEHLLTAGILEFVPDKAGRWWDNNNEIDIVGLNDVESKAVFAEVKWTAKPADVNLYYELKEKAKNVIWKNKERKEYFVFYCKNGFTREFVQLSAKLKIKLFQNDKEFK